MAQRGAGLTVKKKSGCTCLRARRRALQDQTWQRKAGRKEAIYGYKLRALTLVAGSSDGSPRMSASVITRLLPPSCDFCMAQLRQLNQGAPAPVQQSLQYQRS